MALFKKKNEDEEKELLFEAQMQEDMKRCMGALEQYEAQVKSLPEDHLTVKILEKNDLFQFDNYYLTLSRENISFLPSLPSKYTTGFSIRKQIQEEGAESYLRFMTGQDFIRVKPSQVSLTLSEPSSQALQAKDYSLVTKIMIRPLVFEIHFLEGSGLEHIGSMKVQLANQQKAIQQLNKCFPSLGLLSFFNILEEKNEDVFDITLKDGAQLISSDSFKIWREKETLVFMRYERGYQSHAVLIARLPLEVVEYYRLEGDVTYENKISGGGGGGSDYGKAVVGGLLFGAAGAIVASRNEINDIQSERIEHDQRVTVMSVFAENQRRRIVFNKEALEAFHRLIPEKDYDTLALRAQESAQLQAAPREASIPEQIMQLVQLKDMGALTEAEFNEAKQALLAKLKS